MYSPSLPSSHLSSGLSVYPSVDSVRSRYDISIPAPGSERKEKVPVIFTIDSLNRNYVVAGRMGLVTEQSRTNFPRHDYTVPLPSSLRDSIAIELIKATIPLSLVDQGDKERYVILGIGYERTQGNSSVLTGSFCNIYANGYGKYDYTRSDTYADGGHTYYFNEPSTVAKLHITFRYPDGSLPCWEGSSFNLEHVLTFKIWSLNQPTIISV